MVYIYIMENNQNTIKPGMNSESKAKFFAQYYGQIVALVTKGSLTHPAGMIHVISGQVINTLSPGVKHNYSLLLTPLSDITDEDAIEVAKILGCIKPSYDRYINYFLIRDDGDQPYTLYRSGFTFKLWFSDCSLELVINGKLGQITNSLQAYDYLRSKGYALPWMGYSVEDMLQAGWIKLKGGK